MPTPRPTRRVSGWLWAGLALAAGSAAWSAYRALDPHGTGPERVEPARLELRVLAADAPVGSAEVSVSAALGRACDGYTGEDGRIELEGCPVGQASLRIEARGFVRLLLPIALARGDNTLEQSLEPAALLRGRVADERGVGLGGARVLVRPSDTDSAERAQAAGQDGWSVVTAADGGFDCDTLPAGLVSVSVELAGYESESLPDVQLPELELAVSLERMASVSGSVVGPNSLPLDAVEVRLAGSGAWPPRSAASDAAGVFHFGSVPPGIYELKAEHGDLVSAPLEGVSVEAGEDVRIELSLGRGLPLVGSVRDAASGQPLSGARVRVVEDALSTTPKLGYSRGDGSFALPGLRMLEHRVLVELPGYVAIEQHWSPGAAPFKAALLRASRLAGRVEDGRGTGVSSAGLELIGRTSTGSSLRLQNVAPLVSASDGRLVAAAMSPPAGLSLDNLGVTQGEVPPIPLAPGAGHGPALGSSPGFRSGPDGRYELTGVPPGEYRLWARKAGYVSEASPSFDVAAGAGRELDPIVLERGGTVRGRVVDGRRQPLPQVRVSLTTGLDEPVRSVLTDSDGSFEFDAVPARATLTAQPIGRTYASTQVELDVRPGAPTSLDLILEPAEANLMGRVFDTTGAPVSKARVKLESQRAKTLFAASQLSGEDGRFEFTGLPGPPYTLRVEHAEFAASASVHVADTQRELELVLDPGQALVGTALDASSREPIAGARVSLNRGGQLERTRAGRDGRFEFARIARGQYLLLAEADGYLSESRSLDLTESSREQELGLTPAGSLSGEVVDRIGAPVWNAEVAAGEPPDWPHAVRTDAAGHFVVPGLRAGAAQLHARKGSVVGTSAVFRVHEGVDTPGVVVRFDEVVRDPDTEAPVAQRAPVPPGAVDTLRGDVAAEAAASATPLAFARRGNHVVVERVAPGSLADRLGLRSGDVLVAVNGELVRSPAQARGMLGLAPSSQGWLLELKRDGTPLRLRYFPSR